MQSIVLLQESDVVNILLSGDHIDLWRYIGDTNNYQINWEYLR